MANERGKEQKVVEDFLQLTNDHKNLVNNLSTLEMDLKEHKTVIETLQVVDQDRKCFRLIGGVLCERIVKEILPQLVENKNFIEKNLNLVNESIGKKSAEINKYKEEHKLKEHGDYIIKGGGGAASAADNKQQSAGSEENRNVLVSS